jgi:hypothetical protein
VAFTPFEIIFPTVTWIGRKTFYSVSARGPLSVLASWLGTLRLFVVACYLMLIECRSEREDTVYLHMHISNVADYELRFTQQPELQSPTVKF